jgi:outer membrane protein assembly factor BamB
MIHRRLVADADYLYATPGFDAPVHMLDVATGEAVRVLDGTDFASELILDGGSLYVTVDLDAREAGRRTGTPRKAIVAVDVASGVRRWQTDGFVGIKDNRQRGYGATLTRMHITSGGGRIYTVEDDEIIALDSVNGQEVWRRDRPEKVMTPLEMTGRFKTERHPAGRAYDLCSFLYQDGVVYFWQVIQKKKGWASNIYDIHLQAISASDGKLVWSKMCAAATFMQSIPRIYIAQGLLWVEEELGERNPGQGSGSVALLGLDPKTGEEKRRYGNAAIFDVRHHHRCYPNKATENYLIYSRNGLEYLDFRNGELNINRWLRGICQYGIMPANGLMYSPAQPCSCYPSARHKGFYAYGTENDTAKVSRLVTDGKRLFKGPAYDQPIEDTSTDLASEWPVYRHDAQRTGAVATDVPNDLHPCWTVELNEPATAPTVAAGSVFVAGRHTRKVYALESGTGRQSWSRYVEGLVDTPPTVFGGRVYFGTCDGYVYCLRANDGEIVWRFNANPRHRMIVNFGQLESAWPVHGSVIIKDNVVYFTAGRSSYLDGGIYIYALDAASGNVLRSTRHDTSGHDPPNEVIGTADDLLLQDGPNLFFKNLRFNADTFEAQTANWNKRSVPGPPLSAIGGLLDDSMFDRSAWFIDNNHTDKMIVFNDSVFFAMGWIPNQGTWHNIRYQVGKHRFQVIGQNRVEPNTARGKKRQTSPAKTRALASRTPSVNKATLKEPWTISTPVRISSMVLAGDTLFFGGVPDATDSDELLRSIAGETGGILMAVAANDGRELLKLPLSSPPGWDSMAAARGRLYLTTSNGQVICFAGGKPRSSAD